MDGDLHEGVVAFTPLSPGRESIMLGRVQVGEISPIPGGRGRFAACFRIWLPEAHSRAWLPARDTADAQRQALDKINDWLNAAGVAPIGSLTFGDIE
jgi:hypothetical protein